MVAVKANQTDAFLARLPPDIALIVIFGTDAGRVTELAAAAARAASHRSAPPGEIIRIDDADLEDDPDRLLVELQTLPMFGGAKVVRTVTSRRINASMLKGVLEGEAPPACLIIEAGNLKPTDALRKATDKLPWAASLACYADTDKTVADLITAVLSGAGQTIGHTARDQLVARLGADRSLSRNEIEKLSLYVGESREITESDVNAVVGDASAISLDRINLAVLSGARDQALMHIAQARASGQATQSILLALQRQFTTLHRLASAIAGGKRPEDALRSARPPIHFSIRDQIARALRDWPVETVSRALIRIQATIADTRTQARLEDALTERLVLELSQMATRRR